MKMRFWARHFKNLVFELGKTVVWKNVIIKVIFLALIVVVMHYISPFFLSSEPLNINCGIGRFFDEILPDIVWNGESPPKYLILGPIWVGLGAFLFFLILCPNCVCSILGSWKKNSWIRLIILVFSTVLGVFISVSFFLIISCLFGGIDGSKLSLPHSGNGENLGRLWVSLILLALSLPVFVALWVFRTYDTRQQIEKAQDQIAATGKSAETNTRDNLLSTGLALIASDNVAARCIGLVQLALVRRESPALEEQIDASTQDLTLYEEEKAESDEAVIKLRGAMLENMNLRGANMKGAHLEEAYLSGVNLEGACLERARLTGANLTGANLHEAHLKGACLTGAKLERVIMVDAHLQRMDLKRTSLSGANLKGAHLEGADLEKADLRGADLRKSDLPLELSFKWLTNIMKELLLVYDRAGANLERANLRGADLGGALWKGANFKDAIYDDDTTLPDGFIAEEQGLTKDG